MNRSSNLSRFVGQSDEMLALLAKDGDGEAFTALIQRYAPLVRTRARFYAKDLLDSEDLYQEGMIALLKAVRHYRQGGSGGFHRFAVVCINNKLISALTAHMRDKNAPMRNYLSLSGEDAPEQVAPSDHNPEQLVIQSEEMAWRNQRIENLLSLFERQVLQLYLSSYSYDEMSCQLGSSRKAVDNALQRVRKKLRNVFTNE